MHNRVKSEEGGKRITRRLEEREEDMSLTLLNLLKEERAD
jgi:hypothetical protein